MHAGFRASFDPLTPDSKVFNRYESPALRPLPATDGVERYFAFTTRSPVFGREGSREIWLHLNLVRAGINVPTLEEARLPLLRDATGATSYLDPAWSPDGRFLAYLKTTPNGARPAIYVQEFTLSEIIAEAVTPIGSPILVVPGVDNVAVRNPKWNPNGNTLAYQSTVSGTFDIWTIDVFPTLGTPVRRTEDNSRGEQEPAWSPDGTKIAYTTSIYGPEVLAILDLATPQPHAWSFVEPDAAPVYHRRPSWSGDGTALYYYSPKNEDPNQLPDIWRLDLGTRAKCAISIDLQSDGDPDVSKYEHVTTDGIQFNYFLFTSMAQSPSVAGPNIWRGQRVFNCFAPLPMGVSVTPNTLQLGSGGNTVNVTLSFPPETIAAGYQSASFDGPLEGFRLRTTIIASPTMEGLPAKPDPASGGVLPVFVDRKQNGQPVVDVTWDRKELEEILIERRLFGRYAPLKVQAYSNVSGRAFQGFAYIKLMDAPGNEASAALRLRQNEPNPFQGDTAIRFGSSAAGRVQVRIFNARGQLVRTVADRWFPAGANAVSWDGRDDRGRETPSGIYYAQASGENGVRDRVKMLRVR